MIEGLKFLTGERMTAIYAILIALWSISFVRKQWTIENAVKENEYAHSPLVLTTSLSENQSDVKIVDLNTMSITVSKDFQTGEATAKTEQTNEVKKLPHLDLTIKSGRILSVYRIISNFRTEEPIVNLELSFFEEKETVSKQEKIYETWVETISGLTIDNKLAFYVSCLVKGTGDKNYLIMQCYDGEKQYLLDDLTGLSTKSNEVPLVFYEEYQKLRQYLIERGTDL
jgi:hypothetical protein